MTGKLETKDKEKMFLAKYQAYWKEEDYLEEAASWDFCRMAELKAARLLKKEIDYQETVEETDGEETVQGDAKEIQTVKKERKITKVFRRHGRTMYKKALTAMTSLTWKEGEAAAFYSHEDFTASLKRYFYVANQLAAFPVIFLYLMLPTAANTVWNRLRDILLCVAVVLPVMWILAWLLCTVREGYNKSKRRKAEAAREQTEAQIQKKWPKISAKELRAAIDTQIKLIHFSTDKAELKSFGCEEPGVLLVRYEDVCDCSVGAVRYGFAEEGKRRIRIPADVRVYILKDNGRNLVPGKETVQVMMEYRDQWRIVEYKRGARK